jgi:GAF domain-containing protein
MSVSDTQTFVDALAEVFERTENPERITAVLVRELARELGLTAASLLAIEPVEGDTFQLRTLATYSRRDVDSLPPATFDRQVEIPADSALHGAAPITEIPSVLIAAGESYDVALPLTVRHSARAVLLVRYGPAGRRLTSEAWRAVRPLVLTAVTANRAFSRFRRYETQLERRLRVAPDFRFDQNADELFVRARKIFGPGRMFVLQLDPEDQALALLAANWQLVRSTPGVSIPLEGGVLGESVAERQPSLISALPSGDVKVGQRVTRPLPEEADLLSLGAVLVVPIRNGDELVGAFGLERVASAESELKASAEAATFFAALGRILAYSRVHESLLIDNGRVELVNRAAKKLREGEFQIESRLFDRATALETLSADGMPDKSLAQLARELRFGIDTLVKTFSQLVGFVDALYQVGHAGLEIGETLEAYLTKVVLLLRDRLGYERVIMLLADAKQGVLQNPMVSFQYEGPEEEREIGGLKLDYLTAKRSVWAWVARNQREL